MKIRIPSLAAVVVLAATTALAQSRDFSNVEVTVAPVRAGIYVLTGAGGNIGVSSGRDGMLVVDSQFAPLAPKIRKALSGINESPVRFVLNTHWHGDHTGGNASFGGGGIPIVSHENVRRRMSVPQALELFERNVPASPDEALPIVTFTDDVTFHLNQEVVHVFHVPRAHTDGDAVVHFRKADVLHTGDVYFNGLYPFIDVSSGGSIDGLIAAVDRVLDLCGDRTTIIPGHGPVSNAKELAAYGKMLKDVRGNVAALIQAGKDLEGIRAERPTAPFDEDWGGGFIEPDIFVEIVHASLVR